jgi:predicted nucleotidyltransferase
MDLPISFPGEAIVSFCRRWHIAELAFFGSVLRTDFRPNSDIDVLISFLPGTQWTLLDHQQMEDELAAILGRPVDLVSRRGIERSPNALRRQEILSTARTVYAAAG